MTTPRGIAAVLNVEHGLDVGGAVAGETLVRPAQRVRRQDDVVELQDRIVGIGRLLFEDVEPGAGDAAAPAAPSVSAFWSTIGPRAVLMR